MYVSFTSLFRVDDAPLLEPSPAGVQGFVSGVAELLCPVCVTLKYFRAACKTISYLFQFA